ncbi:heptaprenyl diphosphate synthase component 1 [Bacillus sp. DJP31]|uniref:heptaprenyl diphosphate synthase component 1 n=1 Tax=Bacillus sp. DJP31 TaxID=3409789 RepID=UPI003BB5845E
MSDINRKKAYMLEKIHEYIHHPYLKKFIKSPKVDEDKLFLLVAMCNDIEMNEEKKDSYIITTMLVQVALDTHEEVSISNTLQDSEQKEQQLKVLAGDYYSGLYYSLLAEIEDINMIQILATSIKRINEHKIRVYRKDSSYNDSLVDSVRIIESELFRNVANAFQLSFWKEIIPELLVLKRLYFEKLIYERTGSSVIIQYLLKESDEECIKYSQSKLEMEKQVLTNFEQVIVNTRERVHSIISNTSIHSSILNSLQSMVNGFEHTIHQIVEER